MDATRGDAMLANAAGDFTPGARARILAMTEGFVGRGRDEEAASEEGEDVGELVRALSGRLEPSEEAVALAYRARSLLPLEPSVLNLRANALRMEGRHEEALQTYLDALSLAPGDADLFANLGNLLLEMDRPSDAVGAFESGLEAAPDNVNLLLGIGNAHYRLGRFRAAMRAWRRAAELDPLSPRPWRRIGELALSLGVWPNARAAFSHARMRAPDDIEVWSELLFCQSRVYASADEASRARTHFLDLFPEWIDRAMARADDPRLAAVLSRHSTYYLQYHGEDDTEIQAKMGRLLVRVALSKVSPYEPPARPSGRSRMRVGYVSAHFKNHTIATLAGGFIHRADRSRFEVYTYYIGDECTAETRALERSSDVFRHLRSSPWAIVECLRRDELDAVVFTDLGMHPPSSLIAAARVAPHQMLFWGHPVTSGLPSMDAFVSVRSMEPPEAVRHYTESLILLDGPGACVPWPFASSGEPPRLDRADFGLKEDEVVFLSSQTLQKYHPRYDSIYPSIAARVPASRFVFIAHPFNRRLTERLRERLASAFEEAGVDPRRHLHFVPALSHRAFLDLHRLVDVYLDTPAWSGGRTSLEAIACGVPMVSWRGPFMRRRHTAAFLELLGLADWVVDDREAYVERAAVLGRDPDTRGRIAARMIERAPYILFDQESCVRRLEAELAARIASGS